MDDEPREEKIMGIKVREKVAGSGEFWIFINYKGVRRSKKAGSEETAQEVKKRLDAKIVLVPCNI
jgi:integrase